MLTNKFCSASCRKKAKTHRNSLWRKTEKGKKAKQEENRKYREKNPDYQKNYRKHNLEKVRKIERESKKRYRLKKSQAEKSETQKPKSVDKRPPLNQEQTDVHKGRSGDEISLFSHNLPKIQCHRPGCYELFSVKQSFKHVHKYCSDCCRVVMRTFTNLCAQLKYRRTDKGNYNRKIGRKTKFIHSASALYSGP